uniref:Uncharacterized protein n=1 Tax=Oryza barthii TaxID=65489 RepID=A0A0D3G6F0_9ORYZ
MAASGSRRQPATWVGSGDVNVPRRFPCAVGGRAEAMPWAAATHADKGGSGNWHLRQKLVMTTTLLLLLLTPSRCSGDANANGGSSAPSPSAAAAPN